MYGRFGWHQNCWYRTGLGNVRPAGHMRPANIQKCRKWTDKSPFSLKSVWANRSICPLYLPHNKFCFQCGQKELPTHDIGCGQTSHLVVLSCTCKVNCQFCAIGTKSWAKAKQKNSSVKQKNSSVKPSRYPKCKILVNVIKQEYVHSWTFW